MFKFLIMAGAAVFLTIYGYLKTYYPQVLDLLMPNRTELWQAFCGFIMRFVTSPIGILIMIIMAIIAFLILRWRFRNPGAP